MQTSLPSLRILQHFLFWLVFLIYRLTSTTTDGSLIGEYWWGNWEIVHLLVVEVSLKALFAYVFVYGLVPRLLDRGKYLLFGLLSLVWLYVICGVHVATYCFYFERIYTVHMGWVDGKMTTYQARMTHPAFLLHVASKFLAPAVILGAIKFYKRKMELSRVEEEKNKMELQALKNQLNPHFLFNTLNNIYSVAVNDAPAAPDMIMRLSGMLDYALYRSQQRTVPLAEEVTSIRNFIGLEEVRYGDRLRVNCRVEGDLSVPVSPLLFLSLVENAFKHGASGDVDEPRIDIVIRADRSVIRCDIQNTKGRLPGELSDAPRAGIGLSNVRGQLQLLYPGAHELAVIETKTTFRVDLMINPQP